MIRIQSKLIMVVVVVVILITTSLPALGASYNYVDVPVYEPSANDTSGYIWLSDSTNWMLIWWQCSLSAEYIDGSSNIYNVPINIRFGVDEAGNYDSRVHFSLSNNVDRGDLDYLTITVSVIGSSLPNRTYVYENTDPGNFPTFSLSNGLYTVQDLYNVTFLYAGNLGDIIFYNRTGMISTTYHLNKLSLPRFLNQHVTIDGALRIESTTEQNNAISDVADRLDMAADKLESLASQMQVNRPQLDSISSSTPIDISIDNNAVLSSLTSILNIDFVQTLIISSLGLSILFLLLRGTLV